MFITIVDQINHLDAELLRSIQNLLSFSFLDSFFVAITDLHKQIWFQLGVILPLILFWFWREGKLAIKRFGGLVITLLLIDAFCGQIIKKVFARPRPFIIDPEIIQKSPASGFGFVSNHTANMVGLAFFLSHYYPRYKVIWWSLPILIGFSRIYNGVHFVSDVLVGGLMGWLISWLVAKELNHRFKLEQT